MEFSALTFSKVQFITAKCSRVKKLKTASDWWCINGHPVCPVHCLVYIKFYYAHRTFKMSTLHTRGTMYNVHCTLNAVRCTLYTIRYFLTLNTRNYTVYIHCKAIFAREKNIVPLHANKLLFSWTTFFVVIELLKCGQSFFYIEHIQTVFSPVWTLL